MEIFWAGQWWQTRLERGKRKSDSRNEGHQPSIILLHIWTWEERDKAVGKSQNSFLFLTLGETWACLKTEDKEQSEGRNWKCMRQKTKLINKILPLDVIIENTIIPDFIFNVLLFFLVATFHCRCTSNLTLNKITTSFSEELLLNQAFSYLCPGRLVFFLLYLDTAPLNSIFSI